jgi:hypothetical protein
MADPIFFQKRLGFKSEAGFCQVRLSGAKLKLTKQIVAQNT